MDLFFAVFFVLLVLGFFGLSDSSGIYNFIERSITQTDDFIINIFINTIHFKRYLETEDLFHDDDQVTSNDHVFCNQSVTGERCHIYPIIIKIKTKGTLSS